MSISDTLASLATAPAKTTTSWIPSSAEDVGDLRELDTVFERMRKHIPDAPYIITVPCAEPRYHHWSRESAESWCRGTTFDPSEERLQYMSFLYRDHADSCFVCRTEVDEERDRRAAMKVKGVPSGVSTPSRGDVPKKKISLAAYKSKQANGLLGTPSSMQTSSQEQLKKEDTPAQEMHKLPPKPPAPEKSPGQQSHKRSHEDVEDKHSVAKAHAHAKPPTKKPRSSDSSVEKPVVNTPTSTPHGLPPLVSPILSPSALGLPPLLSPTLPEIVEAELKKQREEQQKHSRTSSTTSSSSEQKAPAFGTPSTTRIHQADTTTKGAPQVAGKKPVLQKPPEQENKAQPRPPEATSKAAKAATDNSTVKLKPPPDKPRRLIVRLRYGRKRKQEVERLLRLPPSRKAFLKEHESITVEVKESERIKKAEILSKNREAASKEAPQRLSSSAASDEKESKPKNLAEKRPRANEDVATEPAPVKRPRAPSNIETEKKPRTPTQKEIQSPSLSTKSSAQKPQYLTPSKTLKSTSMMRTVSSESNGVNVTPGQSAGTPVVAGSVEHSSTTASTPSNGRASETGIWQTVSRKLNPLGRKLKHDLQSLMANKPPVKERKRAAAMAIECLLTYMAAYTCQDYMYYTMHRPGDIDSNWRTLLPLHRYLKSACAEFPHLEGLRLQLGATVCARIAAIITHHGPSSTAANKERDKDKDSSAAEKSLSTLDSMEKAARVMCESHADMIRFVAESRVKLPIEDLISCYPKTWQGRAKADELKEIMAAGAWEHLLPGVLEGGYVLPLAADTTPVQALRLGVAFLEEWMGREGVDYKLQLKL